MNPLNSATNPIEENATTCIHSEFGPHLMLDCRQCDPALIRDLAYIHQFLYDLPEHVGMTKITQPYVFPYKGLIPADRGVTGMVIIAESHLTFHSFIEKDYFFFDMFSCRHFDTEWVKAHVIETFKVKDCQSHHVSRGAHFPRTLEERLPMTASDTRQDISNFPVAALVSEVRP